MMEFHDPRLPGTFWDKALEAVNGCWVWVASRYENGYGEYWDAGAQKKVRAHRYAYEAVHGPIPTDLVADHLCRIRCCVNPTHIELVTNAENIRRGKVAKAEDYTRRYLARGPSPRRRRCPHGHDLTDPANVYVNPNSGKRACRACHRLRSAQRYAATRPQTPSDAA